MLILRLQEVKKVFGYRSNASVYKAIRSGLFTRGVAIGQRAKGWPDYEVNAIVESRVAGATDDELKELVRRLECKRTELKVVI
jgi:prophage regulatory protein